MHTFERIFVAINKWVVVLLLAAMSSIVFANVSLRYLSNFSITWAEEVARYLMIWMTFLGAGLSLRIPFISTALLLGMQAALLPIYGTMGAASANIVAAIAGFVMLALASRKAVRAQG